MAKKRYNAMGQLMAAPNTIFLCAVRFWSHQPGSLTPTLRRGVRHVARKQGVTPRELDAAERALVATGHLKRSGKRMGAAIGLTEKGLKLSSRVCQNVSLAPWDWKATFPFAGARRKRRRR